MEDCPNCGVILTSTMLGKKSCFMCGWTPPVAESDEEE